MRDAAPSTFDPAPAAVLFDLDDTLCSYRRSVSEVLAASFDDVGVDAFFEAADYFGRYDDYLDETDGIDGLRATCFADLAAERGRSPDLGRAVAEAYARERDQTNVDLLPGAAEAVEHLGRDHRLGLVTNGAPDMQRTKLDAVDLADAFETVVFAGHDAPRKPDPTPFDRALSDLGVDHDHAVHVGNSPTSDVAGARAAGVRSVWLREEGRSPDRRPDWVVDSLAELVDPPWR